MPTSLDLLSRVTLYRFNFLYEFLIVRVFNLFVFQLVVKITVNQRTLPLHYSWLLILTIIVSYKIKKVKFIYLSIYTRVCTRFFKNEFKMKKKYILYFTSGIIFFLVGKISGYRMRYSIVYVRTKMRCVEKYFEFTCKAVSSFVNVSR